MAEETLADLIKRNRALRQTITERLDTLPPEARLAGRSVADWLLEVETIDGRNLGVLREFLDVLIQDYRRQYDAVAERSIEGPFHEIAEGLRREFEADAAEARRRQTAYLAYLNGR